MTARRYAPSVDEPGMFCLFDEDGVFFGRVVSKQRAQNYVLTGFKGPCPRKWSYESGCLVHDQRIVGSIFTDEDGRVLAELLNRNL